MKIFLMDYFDAGIYFSIVLLIIGAYFLVKDTAHLIFYILAFTVGWSYAAISHYVKKRNKSNGVVA